MMRRTVVLCMLLASAPLVFVSACSRKEVRIEREVSPQIVPPAPSVRPAPVVIVRQPPPPPREEVQVAPPSPGYVWVPGYWTWEGNTWGWVAGRWEQPPERMATWVPGQWIQRGEEWVWRAGHWQ
jgi:hypothetical protein